MNQDRPVGAENLPELVGYAENGDLSVGGCVDQVQVEQVFQLADAEEHALLVKRQYIYVTQRDGTLCAIDTATDTVVNSSAPGGLLAAEDIAGKRLFIADQQDNVVETVTLGKTGPTSDQQGVSFGGMPANSTVVGVSVFSK